MMWVLQTGFDCDGYNSGQVWPFSDADEAQQFADHQNGWSDGLQYYVETDIEVVKEYCDYFGIDSNKYL